MIDTHSSAIWEFSVDRGVRRQHFVESAFSHPAKMHLGLLQRLIDSYTEPGETLLDPMAGSGSLMIAATLSRNVILRDIEHEYVDIMLHSVEIIRRRAGLFVGLIDIGQADAKTLECPAFDHIIFSPPYGFETGRGISNDRRIALLGHQVFGQRWKQFLENPTHASVAAGFRYAGGQTNTGNKSGRNYWRDMKQIYQRLLWLMPPHGRMILVLKNHYRRGKLIDVTGQSIQVLEGLGATLAARHARLVHPLSLWQRRRNEQGLPVVITEDILVFTADRTHARRGSERCVNFQTAVEVDHDR